MRPAMMWGFWIEVVAAELNSFISTLLPASGRSFAHCPAAARQELGDPTSSAGGGREPEPEDHLRQLHRGPRHAHEPRPTAHVHIDRYRSCFPNHARRAFLAVQRLDLGVRRPFGSFRNATVDGAINGMEFHLGVIDDPNRPRRRADRATATGFGPGSPTTGVRGSPTRLAC